MLKLRCPQRGTLCVVLCFGKAVEFTQGFCVIDKCDGRERIFRLVDAFDADGAARYGFGLQRPAVLVKHSGPILKQDGGSGRAATPERAQEIGGTLIGRKRFSALPGTAEGSCD